MIDKIIRYRYGICSALAVLILGLIICGVACDGDKEAANEQIDVLIEGLEDDTDTVVITDENVSSQSEAEREKSDVAAAQEEVDPQTKGLEAGQLEPVSERVAYDSFAAMSYQGLEAYFTEENKEQINNNAETVDIEKLKGALACGQGPAAVRRAAEELEAEYGNFAIADVDKYVNVRCEANTDSEIVGRMYDGAVAQIQEEIECEDGTWLNVVSGSLNGYIKAEYFIYGHDAVEVIDDYIDRYAVVNADRLNIRENPDLDSKRIGYALTNEKLKLADKDTEAEWLHVNYAEDKNGYVSGEYVTVVEEFIYAKTMDEIKAEEEAEKERKAREKESEKKTPENVQVVQTQTAPASTATYSASGNLRSDVVNFALQYVGHPYVHGGNSLENGTDCSGFTSLVYAQFGVGLSRTPGGQLSGNGRSVSLDQIQPGDIVCYGKSRCTHVGIYIGNGQIVHAANPRKGIVTQNVGYDNILGVKNVVD